MKNDSNYIEKMGIGAIALIKMARVLVPDLGLVEAKKEYDAFKEIWADTVGNHIFNNEHYHTYFVLLYITLFQGDAGQILALAERVPAEVKAPYYATAAAMIGVERDASISVTDTLIESLAEMHDKSVDVLDNLLKEIDDLEEAEEAADEAEAEENAKVARHVSNPNLH